MAVVGVLKRRRTVSCTLFCLISMISSVGAGPDPARVLSLAKNISSRAGTDLVTPFAGPTCCGTAYENADQKPRISVIVQYFRMSPNVPTLARRVWF